MDLQMPSEEMVLPEKKFAEAARDTGDSPRPGCSPALDHAAAEHSSVPFPSSMIRLILSQTLGLLGARRRSTMTS